MINKRKKEIYIYLTYNTFIKENVHELFKLQY